MKKIVCFGEILMDILPNGNQKIGGAPLNVAYHLKKLGVGSGIISRIGNDKEGEILLQFFKENKLPTDLLQRDGIYPTGRAIATLAGTNEMVYDIVFPSAWDFIAFDDTYRTILRTTDAFVFGSLATRNDVSRTSLYTILEYSSYKVFDINIRKPHADMAVIGDLLSKSNLVKLNEVETKLLGEHFDFGNMERQIVERLLEKFGVQEIIVTKGENGGTYYNAVTELNYQAVQVKVKDTVGSGDSFLAGFLKERVQGAPIEKCLDTGSKLSGLITSLEGGCPDYNIKDIGL
ncbi:PfkB domain protein [Pseudopedobacter saltans DSM 12145]|uniref:PfkB domain protein n=1 Tax=Pseudopedobacter saltans (strain ATCC 51119 / DSM 12145 / JCM 21818 / CCUG 39354 / LMG 10337 / NBRC 100064 / NCIMB 13643) TaxID=762903 RepID=F0SE52_PSESL|nr:carbohydrate kinase [Pseudopedobacter saltans]ADY52978.1 PfkB domain protein [Pseudopedobacter saltans DSM 12145]